MLGSLWRRVASRASPPSYANKTTIFPANLLRTLSSKQLQKNQASELQERVQEEEDVVSRMMRVDRITSSAPPKNLMKKRPAGGILINSEYLSLFQPCPQIDGLPPQGLHTQPDGSIRRVPGFEELQFEAIDPAQNFIQVCATRLGLGEAQIFKLALYNCPQRQIAKVRAAATLALPPLDALRPEYRTLTALIGIGEGKTLTEARKAARMDLAERLYRVLAEPTKVKKGAVDVALDEASAVRIGLRLELREAVREGLESVQGRFQVEDESCTDEAIRKREHVDHILLPQLKKFPLPPRVQKHPLPVCKEYSHILSTIAKQQVTILSAATGSGKTTQLPQFILEQYAGSMSTARPRVIVTQPRRIAAKSVAQRVAEERGERLGESIGYSVRFEARPPRRTADGSVLFCTSGVLLRMLQSDPELARVSHLVLDEVHERDVYTDLLLMMSRRLLARRPDLKVILMSATMPIERLEAYYRDAGFTVGKALDIKGTNFPVTPHYLQDVVQMVAQTEGGKHLKQLGRVSDECRIYIEAEMNPALPPTTTSSNSRECLMIEQPELRAIPYELVVALISLIDATKGPGAILCFLPGWEELSATHKLLQDLPGLAHRLSIHVLHSTSPAGTTEAVFEPAPQGTRKLILSTNIAESSVTLPDVVYIVDAGKQKIMHYDQRHRMNLLETSWASQANLRQRMGRAGRVRPGEYYCLMAKERAEVLPEQTPPEILRLGLEEVCLGIRAMGLKEGCEEVLGGAVDPPERLAIRKAVQRLVSLGAMQPVNEVLTPLGRLLAHLPLHPAFGRMLVMAVSLQCVDPILTVVAGLGERILKPARLPSEKAALRAFFAQQADDLHSDHLLTHRLFSSGSSCCDPFTSPVSFRAMKRVGEIRRNLDRLLRSCIPVGDQQVWNANSGNEALLRMVIAAGFYPDIALHRDKRNSYQLQRLKEVKLAGSSCAFEGGPLDGLDDADKRIALRRRPSLSHCSKPRPVYHVYEDLMDLGGHKMIMKLTAVDPLAMLLLSERLVQKRDFSEAGSSPLLADDWLTVYPEAGKHGQADLGLISEVRTNLSAYLKWSFHRLAAMREIAAEEQELRMAFVNSLLALLSHSSIFRPRLLASSSSAKK